MSEQLFQVGIKAVIRNEEGEVLLQAFRQQDGSVKLWDLPGGRMNPGETFTQTLRRELKEEIGIDYIGEPKHLMTVQANVSIHVGDVQYPLLLIAYKVNLPKELVPEAAEKDSIIEWINTAEAAKRLAIKFPSEFCAMIAAL